VAGDDNKLIVYDVADRNIINEYIMKSSIYSTCFNKEGNLLAFGGVDKIVNIHNIYTREKIRSFKTREIIKCCYFSPDSINIAFGCTDNVC